MPLTVLNVAYPMTEVGPDAVGGSEQILTILDRALTEAGHQSLVLAAAGSNVTGTLIPSEPMPKRMDEEVRIRASVIHGELIRQILAECAVDVIHMHSLDFHRYLPPPPVPVLATLHLPPNWYPREIFHATRPGFNLNCVSHSQLAACPISPIMLPPISNGIDMGDMPLAPERLGYAACLGRVCPEKGYHFALDAARKAAMPLKLAGAVFPYQSHFDYFDKEIAPRLDAERQFVGPVAYSDKTKFLSQAACLVVSSSVAETSSLAAMEALACGTPVIAFNVGALPELIESGRTGFIVSNVEEMAEALTKVHLLRAEDCRKAARTRCSSGVMAKSYLDLYRCMSQHPVVFSNPRRLVPQLNSAKVSKLRRAGASAASGSTGSPINGVTCVA